MFFILIQCCNVPFENLFIPSQYPSFVYLDGVRFSQIIFIVNENPLCVTAWIISISFTAISYESCCIVSTAVKATLYVGNFQHVI
jgi:hypothetical protein